MSDTAVAEIRAFNRFYTRQLGLLDEHLRDSRFTLSESRVLFETHARRTTTAAELSRTLGADPAFLSRMLWKLTDAGLISLTPSAADKRQNIIALTREGELAFAEIDAAAQGSVAALLKPIGSAEQRRLVDAMQTIRTILGDVVPDAPVVVRPHRIGEVAHVVGRQGELYASEYGWDATYEGLAAEIAGRFLQDYDPECERCFIAERRGEIIGSVFVVYADEGIAQLRLLYVEPSARGLGLGTTLVNEAISFARAAGYEKMRLWTQSSLAAARRIYATAGFTLVREEAHTSFGRDLVGEYWEIGF